MICREKVFRMRLLTFSVYEIAAKANHRNRAYEFMLVKQSLDLPVMTIRNTRCSVHYIVYLPSVPGVPIVVSDLILDYKIRSKCPGIFLK